jgi:L-ascorbate metabolism protein UlaG (beta-lactamase superfamily)
MFDRTGRALNALTWLGHSTVVIEVDGTRLLTDPVLGCRVWHLRREVAVDPRALGRLDGILVSHAHFDHLDHASLHRLDHSVPVVVPQGVGRTLRRWGFERVSEVAAGDELPLGALALRAVPAEHESGRWPLAAKSAALGYLATGSTSVYFAGDTDLFPGMESIAPMEVALLPVSGWGSRLPAGHLDPAGAAAALRLLRPRLAIPIHWGTFRTPFAAAPSDEPAVEFARSAAEVAPEVEVRVLRIGETLPLASARQRPHPPSGDVGPAESR